MNARTHRARPMAVALIALAALVSACVNHNPVDEPDSDPDATAVPTSSSIGAYVAPAVATSYAVTIDGPNT